MERPRPLKHDLVEAEINVMPLIDVCLVLMIILLVVFPMVRVTAAPAVKTPAKPAAGGVMALEQPKLAVEILADGSLTVDGEPVPQAELHTKLREIWTLTPNRPVVLKVDKRVRYAQVRWVLRSAYAAGFGSAGIDR